MYVYKRTTLLKYIVAPLKKCMVHGCVQGIVISDWKGLDRLSEPRGTNYGRSIELAINAGIDMVMVPYEYQVFMENLSSLVESGEIAMRRIDDAVERILRVKFVAGLFEFPYADTSLLLQVGCKVIKLELTFCSQFNHLNFTINQQ